MTLVLVLFGLVVVGGGAIAAIVQYRASGGMPVWVVEAYNEDYQPVRKTIVASDPDAVTAILRRQRLKAESIRLIPAWRRMIRRDIRLSDFRRKIPARQISDMATIIASFVSADVPIQEAIAVYARQKPDNMCREIMRRIQGELSGGRATIAEAFGAYREQLGTEVVAILTAGLTADDGIVGAFQQIAEMSEKRDNIGRQWRKAMTYPTIVLIITLVALAFMLWKVVPSFKSAYASFGAKLPAPTALTIGLSHLLFSHLYVPVILIVGIIMLVSYVRSNAATRLQWDKAATKLPFLGKVIQGAALGRSMATLSSLLAVGVPTQEALRVAIPSAGNAWIEKVLHDVATSLGHASIQEAVRIHRDNLPASLVAFVETGASTADLDSVLRRYAKFAQRDADLAVQNLSTVVEPAMLIIVGALVGTIVISMYLPMIDIVKIIK